MQLSSPLGLIAIVAILYALGVSHLPTAARWGILAFAFVISCASLRPQIQEARDDVVLACRKLTAAMVGDVSPSKAERISQKVCLAETFAERITREVEADSNALFSEELPLDLPPAVTADAGAAH
jgi:hypothetical protein